MAKAASPVRLQDELMQAAQITAKRFHRSTAEQIEYWADLGRAVSDVLDPDVLLSLSSGLIRLKTEPVINSPVDPDTVFQALEQQRESGELSQRVTYSVERYQASKDYPGFLEKIAPDGSVTIGKFENGQFIETIETES